MKNFIALLRGINVSGQKKIKMVDLKALFEKLGFSDVQTYIQSGNIIFNHDSKDTKRHAKTIEEGIRKEFGYDVSVILRTRQEFGAVIENNPFNLEGDQYKKLYISFFAGNADSSKVGQLEKYKADKDEYSLAENHFYFYCPDGYGRTKLSNNTIERVFGLAATTRNWNTVSKLFQLTSDA